MRCVILALVLFVSGCSLMPDVDNTTITKYLIPLPQNVKTKAEKIEKNIKISQPVAPSFLYKNEITYTKGDGIYGSYLYSFWDETPAKQIKFILANALSGVFKNVIVESSSIGVDLSLESQVDVFEYFVDEKVSQVKFKGSLFLVDTNSKKVLKNKKFFIKKDVPIVSPKGAVQGFKEVMESFSDEVVEWISPTLD